MFRNVPECSGMFHVPDFIDGPYEQQTPVKEGQQVLSSMVL